MAARVLTSFAHGTFFGVGSVVATSLVAADRRASAIAIIFTGLTVATILGVPFGTWLGQAMGWRAAFWAVTVVGVVALVIIALFVPATAKPAPSSLREDFRVLGRPAVLLGLLTTVLGFGGVFTVFSYIAPLLTRVSGFGEAAVSPVLLVFGAGLVLGNLLGGRLADRRLLPALLGSMAALAVVLGLMGFVLENQVAVIAFTFLLGVAGFATVPPLQIWVLERPKVPARAWPPASTSLPSTWATPWAPGSVAASSTRAPASSPCPGPPPACRSSPSPSPSSPCAWKNAATPGWPWPEPAQRKGRRRITPAAAFSVEPVGF